ncbi:MAG: DNA-processing protein DprA [Puniceicoccales bacterium]|jgi:DNA processing protein|nr:DNA-processing protein DprA [Puniceicoccales bacterium]
MHEIPTSSLTYDDFSLVINAMDPVSAKAFQCIMRKNETDWMQIFQLPVDALMESYGFSQKAAKRIINWNSHFNVREERERMAQFGARFIPWKSEFYPNGLLEIDDGPIGIYVSGDIAPKEKSISIVGSRQCTFYGEKLANELAYELARSGFTIVSGLAIGVDMAAHLGALRAGGKTVAILPGGIDYIYPSKNRELYGKIRECGTLISELKFGKMVEKWSFSRRNRIIAALSAVTVVIETSTTGGSMITANMARKQGRIVAAIPGMVDQQMSSGCHQLIREGAILIRGAEDIIALMGGSPKKRNKQMEMPFSDGSVPAKKSIPTPSGLNEVEEKIWNALCAYGAQGIDEIAARISLSPIECAQMIQSMVIRGYVKRDCAGIISPSGFCENDKVF